MAQHGTDEDEDKISEEAATETPEEDSDSTSTILRETVIPRVGRLVVDGTPASSSAAHAGDAAAVAVAAETASRGGAHGVVDVASAGAASTTATASAVTAADRVTASAAAGGGTAAAPRSSKTPSTYRPNQLHLPLALEDRTIVNSFGQYMKNLEATGNLLRISDEYYWGISHVVNPRFLDYTLRPVEFPAADIACW